MASNFLKMELESPLMASLVALTIFVLVIKRFLTSSGSYNLQVKNLPPGPRKLPFIGNMHQLAGLPHRCLAEFANKYGPLMHLQLGEISAVVASTPEAAREIMKTHDTVFAQRPFLLAADIMFYHFRNIAFAPCGDYWRQLRKMANLEMLSAGRVQSFRSIREEEVAELVRYIAANAGSRVNLSEKVFAMTYSITSRAAFGNKCEEIDEFVSYVREAVMLAGGFSPADLFPSYKLLHSFGGVRRRLEDLHKPIDRILVKILNEHRERKEIKKSEGEQEDLVDVMLNCQENWEGNLPLTDNDIKANVLDTFSAGSETSSATLEWALAELLKNPTSLKKAQAEVRQVFSEAGKVDEARINELKFLKLVIKETLRMHPPAPLLVPRECGANCKIFGYDIPVKTKVMINAWAIGRNPDYWNEPEKFFPERFLDSSIDYKGTNFEFIPFGSGRRICPGILFGIANIELPLASLLYHFDWQLPNGTRPEDLDMTEAPGATVTKKVNINLVPIPYNPTPSNAGN